MNKTLFLTFISAILINVNIIAQNNPTNNFDIINLFEAYKIIENRETMPCDTPVIAIIDKGVNLNHEDLKNNIWSNKHEIPKNGIDDDNNGFIDDINGWNFKSNTNDISIGGVGNWHGTPVNGIIGSEHNNKGIKGISSKVKLMNIVKGESVESIINAMRYIHEMRKKYNRTDGKEGAFIVAVNSSWGKDSLWAKEYPDWCSMYDSLGNEGVLSIASAPNENIDIDLYGDMPSTCKSEYLITVTNSNQYDEKNYDAGFGRSSVDLAAPGDKTYTTLNPGGYGYFNGTSAAAPYVTGVIGLLYLLPSDDFQQHIKQNPPEIALVLKLAILDGVDNLQSLENTVSGGRLNAFNSMKLLCDNYGEQHLYKKIFEQLSIISVYPNPAKNQTSLLMECNSNLEIIITLVDLNGKILHSENKKCKKGIGSIPIDLSSISGGFYIINVSSYKTTKSIKLVIQ